MSVIIHAFVIFLKSEIGEIFLIIHGKLSVKKSFTQMIIFSLNMRTYKKGMHNL